MESIRQQSTLSALPIATMIVRRESFVDPGEYLLQLLRRELQANPLGLKAKLWKLHKYICSGETLITFQAQNPRLEVEDIMEAEEYVSWDCGGFVSTSLMYLTTPYDDPAVKKVTSSFAKMIWEERVSCDIEFRRCNALEVAYERSLNMVEAGRSVVMAVTLLDETILSPSASFKRSFSHTFTMVVSFAGVFIYQAYGPNGYSLQDYFERHNALSSHREGRSFVVKLTNLMKSSRDERGRWTETSNELFKELFEVDLVSLGHMTYESPFNPFLVVEMHLFNAKMVYETMNMLPKSNISSLVGRSQERPLKKLFLSDNSSSITTSTRKSLLGGSSQLMNGSSSSSLLSHNRSPKIKSRFVDYPLNESYADFNDPLDLSCSFCSFRSSHRISMCKNNCGLAYYCCYEHERRHRSVHKEVCDPWGDVREPKLYAPS